MSHECRYCNEKINKNDEFILEGKYPGFGKRYKKRLLGSALHYGLDEYGEVYHKECYYKMAKDDELIHRVISRIESTHSRKS